MDSKDGKKKESIDEILSDLNGLLNKMPSILDGIRMPEIKPVEFSAPAPAPKPAAEEPAPVPEPEKEIPQPAFNADQTIVLQPFAGLQEGSPVPAEKPAAEEAAAQSAEAAKTEAEALVPQSLGDFMFGEDAQEQKPAETPAAKLSGEPVEPPVEAPAPGTEAPTLLVSPLTPPEDQAPEAGLVPADSAATELPDLSFQPLPEFRAEEPSSPQPDAGLRPAGGYDNTRDFGVPDIDALMQLSQDEIPAKQEPQPQSEPLTELQPEPQPEPKAEPQPEPAPEPEAIKEEPSMDELAEFERQLKAAGEQGGEMENKPGEEKQETSAEEAGRETAPVEPAAAPVTGFEGLTIEPEVPAQPEAQPEPAAQPQPFGEINLSPAAPGTPEEPAPQPEPSAGIELGGASQAENTLRLEPGSAPEAQPEPAAQAEAPREMELSVGRPADEVPQAEPAQGLVLEPSSAFMSGQQPQASGEETLVVPPPAGTSGEEERTVIYDPGAEPGSTSRSQAGDFDVLSIKQPPEGIPAERVRSVVFLYAPEEKAFCAAVLAELDAICLKSPSKPMFIRRASVRECASDMNANYILQMTTDVGAIGLVCVGAIPQEKIYEVENVFTSSGGFFRHYDSANFSHSAALDLVSDLILRV